MPTVLPNPIAVKAVAKVYVEGMHLAVIPLEGKIPVPKNWQDGHICTTAQVEKLFRPSHNIGIVTGRYAHDADHPQVETRYWVLDVDWKEETVVPEDAPAGTKPTRVAPTWGEDGRPTRTPNTNLTKNGYPELDKLLSEHGVEMPQTWIVRTGGGGLHYYFALPAGVTIPGTAGLRPYIDVRGDRGQVVAPPSVHPETGVEYEWTYTCNAIAETPKWLLDVVTEKARQQEERKAAALAAAAARVGKAKAEGVAAAVSPTADRNYAEVSLIRAANDVRIAAEGQRHDVLYRKTFRIRKLYGGRGTVSDAEIEAAFVEAGIAAGLDDAEVEKTVADAMAEGAAQQDEAYDATPTQVNMNFGSFNSATTPPPPTTLPGNGAGGTPPPPPPPSGPPPAAAAPAPTPAAPRASRNPAYPVDFMTLMAMSRFPDTRTNGVVTRFGGPKPLLSNISIVFRQDPAWSGHFWYNEMTNVVMYQGKGLGVLPRQFSDADAVRVVLILSEQYNLDIGVTAVHSAVLLAADTNKRNPLVDYLGRLVWDGVPRIDTWLQSYMGVQDLPLYRKMGRKWLVAAVARALTPGCKADALLIIKGPQNAGKSTAFKALAGADYFDDTPFEMDSKDRFDYLRGAWIYEIAELSNFTRADANALKGFLSSQVDKYRPPYMRVTAEFPRRVLFCGTTNDAQFLIDSTGTRRFWVVECSEIVDVAGIAAARDQLWAEAVAAFGASEEYWLDRADDAVRADDADQFSLHDPLLAVFAQYCRALNNDKFTAASIWRDLVDSNRPPSVVDARRIAKLLHEVGTHKPARYYTSSGVQIRGYVRTP